MKSAIRKIDRALKNLYNLDPHFRAEDFLLKRPPNPLAGPNGHCRGALFIREQAPVGNESNLQVGIYLNEPVQEALAKVAWRNTRRWTSDQVSAFSVAAEEVSHFHYLLFHAAVGRPVSQFELELQGDIDKFLLSYFLGTLTPVERAREYEALFHRMFVDYRLNEGMSEADRARYEDANAFARRFIRKWGVNLRSGTLPELGLRILRRYYRLGAAEKVSFISSD